MKRRRRRDRVPPTAAPATRYYVFPCGCTSIGSRGGELVTRCDGRDCYLVKSGRATP